MSNTPSSRNWALLAVAVLTLAGVALLFAFLGREPEPKEDHPRVAPASPTTTHDPIVAQLTVEEEPHSITYSFWQEAVLLDQVLSGLAGQTAPTPEDTLQRLINEELVLQASSSVEHPTEEQIQARVAALEQAWGVDDTAVTAALETVGLTPAALHEAIGRLLRVEAGLDLLRSEGHDVSDWLDRQRADADIEVFDTAAALIIPTPRSPVATPRTSPLPSPTTQSPIPSPPPAPATETPPPTTPPEVPEVAADFALNRSGGGTLTLSEQLAQGPVVLVFFPRGGG